MISTLLDYLIEIIIWVFITAAGVFFGLEAHARRESIFASLKKKKEEFKQEKKEETKGCCGGGECGNGQ